MKFLPFLVFFIFSVKAAGPLSLQPIVRNDTVFNSQLASGGSITSVGGGDTSDLIQLSAWFYGSKEVSTCISYNEIFGVSQRQITPLIHKAINAWQSYFNKNSINSFFDHQINTNFIFKGDCKGGEDLVLFFGTGPIFGNLGDLKAVQKLNNPAAYVNKTHISKDKKWSKGYIRFLEHGRYLKADKRIQESLNIPDWTLQSTLYNFILHEFGHILGFEHKSLTIMDEQISYKSFISKQNISSNIDGEVSLLTDPMNKRTFVLAQIFDENLLRTIWSKKPIKLSFQLLDAKNMKLEVFLDDEINKNETLNSTTIVLEDNLLPLYTNFQEKRESESIVKSSYFNARSTVLSFDFQFNKTLLIINGQKAARLSEVF